VIVTEVADVADAVYTSCSPAGGISFEDIVQTGAELNVPAGSVSTQLPPDTLPMDVIHPAAK